MSAYMSAHIEFGSIYECTYKFGSKYKRSYVRFFAPGSYMKDRIILSVTKHSTLSLTHPTTLPLTYPPTLPVHCSEGANYHTTLPAADHTKELVSKHLVTLKCQCLYTLHSGNKPQYIGSDSQLYIAIN